MIGDLLQWVGALANTDSNEFVRVQASGTGDRVVLDLPAHGLFNLTATLSVTDQGNLKVAVASDGVSFELSGRPGRDGSVEGTYLRGQHPEGFVLWPVSAPDTDAFTAHFGDLVAPNGRRLSLHLNRDDFFGEPMLMYAEGDRVVRLHPLGRSRYLSEDAELVELGNQCWITTNPVARSDARLELRCDTAWSERPVTFAAGDIEIAGNLMLPPGDGPFPAIALVHGAAGGTRELYRLFGARFAAAGIAALVYDKRGTGATSAGSRRSTLAVRADDAESAVAYLMDQDCVDSRNVGLWGFSNGAWSVAMVAGRRSDLGFAIVVGGPGVTPARSEIFRKSFELTEHGVAAADIGLVERAWELIYRYLSDGSLTEADSALLDNVLQRIQRTPALREIPIQQYAVDDPVLAPVPGFADHHQLPRVAESSRDLGYDPFPDWAHATCPVLALCGERDANQPARLSVERIGNAVAPAGTGDFTGHIFPGAGHMLNLVDAAEIRGITTEELSYRFERFRFAAGALDTMTTWVCDRTPRRSSEV